MSNTNNTTQTKSPEFFEFIQDYMLRCALRRVKDMDKAEDIVQYAWTEALKTVDFTRSDEEVRDYLIEAVKLVMRNDWKRSYATGTNIHDADNSVLISELEARQNQKLDATDSYHIPTIDPEFSLRELMFDIGKVFHRLSEIEQKFFKMIFNGYTVSDASVECNRTKQWSYQRFQKLAAFLNNS